MDPSTAASLPHPKPDFLTTVAAAGQIAQGEVFTRTARGRTIQHAARLHAHVNNFLAGAQESSGRHADVLKVSIKRAVPVETLLENLLPSPSPAFQTPVKPRAGTPQLPPHATLPESFEGELEEGPGPAEPTTPLDSVTSFKPEEDQEEHKPLCATLNATYHFTSVTGDGGVGLSFESLQGADASTATEELHTALQLMLTQAAEAEAAEEAAGADEDEAGGTSSGRNFIPELMKSLVFMKHEALSKSRVVRERSSHSTLHEVSEMEPSQDGPEQLCQHLSHEPRSEPSLRLDSSASMGLPSHSTSPDRLSWQEGAVQPQRASEDADSQMDLQLPLPPPLKPQDPAAVSVGTPPEAPQLPAAAVPPLNTSIRMPFHGGKLRPLNIVMLVVGTRGDVQPFIGIGLKLQEYGHRVRLASHAVYREFITGFGLEFYPLGGDPKVLSEYVVKHRGILPGWDISEAVQQREQVRQILYSTYGACTLPDPLHPDKPMTADAIVANPPAYGHTHCAEKLNVPLHIVFTMPWTPTKVFPQPFARIDVDMKRTNSKAREVMNWLSYFAMEDLAWVGMAGMQKDFRCNVLGLKTWNKLTTSHSIYHSKVPITYIWSPSLVPRPTDWPSHCEVVGFVNVELHKLTSYTPPDELKAFLDSGPPPVYIGFGSLVVDDPDKLTDQFLAALKRTGLRAIIQRGWGGLGSGYGHGAKPSPPDILFIDSAPHDWLFQMSCAVVHHGGAGTTATGLMAGKPTFIVPFFGDQPFWGAACALAGVGPEPVPIDSLTTDSIVNALKELILPTCRRAAQDLAHRMAAENGIANTVDHIHRTIYSALALGRLPVWMRSAPAAEDVASGQATPRPQRAPSGFVPSSRIDEMETEQGEGLMQGILMLPGRLAQNMSNLLARKRDMSNKHLDAALEGSSNHGGPSSLAPHSCHPSSRPPSSVCGSEAAGRPSIPVESVRLSPQSSTAGHHRHGTPVPTVDHVTGCSGSRFFGFLGC